ncbi:hypothetical protein N7472_008981 [Penicillium cf. griseofulvum]|uniref:C2H2-type domain-containing protein n=1 Tax=Penicillium cf. griseofulvum TaxID=2972120 RepID=A0A9W9M7F2_9EURO|nr:hypothetical protein N7472_008981 [Penicillium cf. griseofulvum]
MAASISTVLNQCLKEFTESTTLDALSRYENEVSQRRWSDELGRLRIWAGNIGAHQTGLSSLDYRLRDASHLKSETVKILQRMLRVLRSLTEVMNEEEEGQMEIDEAFPDSDTEMDDDNNEMTDVQVLYQSLRNIINLLFRISMAIRRPADHDRLLGIKIKNASFFEPWAQQHVSHKFPNADANMTSRLSAAMARQKAVLKYFERHKAKLSKGLVVTGETESNYLSETVATEMPLTDNMDQLQFLETASMSGISQTSYAPSMFTATESLSIPNAPRESADNNPFECPYCCLVITIRNTKDWAHHIFRDLMPYVCVSPECSTPSKLYGSRRQWYQHISEAHSVPANMQSGLNCPLCQLDIRPPLTFERHVGHHMEQLALFVLPRVDPGERAQSEASPGSGSLAVVGDTSNPSSDSEEVESPREKPKGLGIGDIANYDEYSHTASQEQFGRVYQTTLQDADGTPEARGSTDRVAKRRRHSSRSNSDEDTLDDGLHNYGSERRVAWSREMDDAHIALLDGGSPGPPSPRSHLVPSRFRVTEEDDSSLQPRTRDGSFPASIGTYSDDPSAGVDEPARYGYSAREADPSLLPTKTKESIYHLDPSLQPSPSAKATTSENLSEGDKHVEDMVAGSSSAIKPGIPAEGTLDPQRGIFPDIPSQTTGLHHPEHEPWTKIDRQLVNPAALEAGNERFEERSGFVIVMRKLSKEEIQAYAVKTQEIRDDRQRQQEKRLPMADSPPPKLETFSYITDEGK